MKTHLWYNGTSSHINPYTGQLASHENYAWAVPGYALKDAGFIRFTATDNWIVQNKDGSQYYLW